jgi:alkanesulfonate monooxygenase SsuD/methylene tetrahydromethanopterin reductase-like flavin-dependent oxidoreductase (luciferase family)
MRFGVFDHLDRCGNLSLKDYYAARLSLIELYERCGFYAYHIAEHHFTSLGMAPSPSVFLSAVAQRTQRLRFGPMVYALPMHHPLRLLEEICMLDHMSGGRLELGFGRGSSPVELEFFNQDPQEAEAIYQEGIRMIHQGLTQKAIDFEGKYFKAVDVPMEIEPLQTPHPPIWYGVHSPQSAERSAAKGFNILGLANAETLAPAFEKFRDVWQESHAGRAYPLMGIGRFVVVGETEQEAMEIGRRAYRKWHDSFTFLAHSRKRTQRIPRPETFDSLITAGQGVAGTPEMVVDVLGRDAEAVQANYLVAQIAFGDMTPAEAERSVHLFHQRVMPELRGA